MCVLIMITVQHIWLTNRWYSHFSQTSFRVPPHYSTRSNSSLNSYFLISLFRYYYYFFCVSYTPYSSYDESREKAPKLS